jgi:Family of unknown function (DUF5681)
MTTDNKSDDRASALANTRCTKWKPGQSGNPRGRAPGCRNRVTVIAESLIGGKAKELTEKAIALALSGDVAALRICLERLVPPARERPCFFKLPKLQTTSDATNALAEITEGLASGKLLPHEAEHLANIVAAFVKTIEIGVLEDRLLALERGRAEDVATREKERHYDA